MVLEKVTQIELNIDEQRRITLDYLCQCYKDKKKSLHDYERIFSNRNTPYTISTRKELAALNAVINILENEI